MGVWGCIPLGLKVMLYNDVGNSVKKQQTIHWCNRMDELSIQSGVFTIIEINFAKIMNLKLMSESHCSQAIIFPSNNPQFLPFKV